MEHNNKAVKAIGFIIASSILNALSFALSNWQESIFGAFASIFFFIGLFQLSNAFQGRVRTFLKILFWVALITIPFFRILNSQLFIFIDKSLYATIDLLYPILFYTRCGIEILAYSVWFVYSKNNKVKSGILMLILPVFFYMIVSLIPLAGLAVYDEFTSKILYDYSKYFWAVVEFIGLFTLIRAYSSRKQISTAILLGMTGATLGIFIVLGDGFLTEFASFVGYIILLVSLGQLGKYTNEAVDVKRLRIAAIIAIVGMLINMIPAMEWLGTTIEFVAYIVAISGYTKLNKSRGIETSLSGFENGVWAMVLLILATIIHAIPSFGVGETLAAMIGLVIVLILSTGWIKSLAAVKTEDQLGEEPELTESEQQPVVV